MDGIAKFVLCVWQIGSAIWSDPSLALETPLPGMTKNQVECIVAPIEFNGFRVGVDSSTGANGIDRSTSHYKHFVVHYQNNIAIEVVYAPAK